MNQFELRPLHTCSFQTALEVWNEGFKGYFVDMTLTFDKLLERLTTSRVSPEYSVVAMDGQRPVGFLFNAIQVIGDKKVAWNGGTGVVPEYRGKGIGKVLVQAAIEIYKSNSVDVASLEAISTNHSAINLYKRFGYEVIDELTYLQTNEPKFADSTATQHQVIEVHPSAAGRLSFYRELSPWQCQWHSLALRGGEAIVLLARDKSPVGYALFERRFDDSAHVTRISLCQCEVAPGRDDAKEVAQLMLQRVFEGDDLKCQRTTVNFPKSNSIVIESLKNAGFNTFIEQLHMRANVR